MRLDDIDPRAVRRAIDVLGDEFRTKDVSRQSHMLDAHGGGTERNYHAVIGRYLSENRTGLGIRLVSTSSGDRGAHWAKAGAGGRAGRTPPRPEVDLEPLRNAPGGDGGALDWSRGAKALDDTADLGPQYAGDRPFTARMRRHQSWYRAQVLGVPCGTGPGANDTSSYGNMLRRQEGARGLNFLTPEIHRAASQRVEAGRGAVEPFRLMHNMLSSQPMCFNLWAPLADDRALATRLMSALLPGEVARVREVAIEWAPRPAHQYLDDRTAFDAFVTYERPDGALAFVGVETKLTEPFSAKRYDGASYRRWMELPGAPWRPDAGDEVADVAHNQLWRDHLLAWSVLRHPESPYVDGRLMLVRHPVDEDCRRTLSRYRKLLRDDRTLLDMPLDRLVAAWEGERRGDPWLVGLRRRYLDLAPSA